MMLAQVGTARAVSLGELVISADISDVIVAYGLGSCVGIALYDPQRKTGGLAHVMLPDAPVGAGILPQHPAKFASNGVQAFLHMMEQNGCTRSRLVCKIAGGAQMIAHAQKGGVDMFRIGERNTAVVQSELRRLGIRVVASDTGGSVGRTMQLFVATGRVTLRAVGQPEREL